MMDRAFTRGWRGTAIAVSAAYGLVLQVLLLSFGSALHAGAAPLPPSFICAPGAAGQGQQPEKAHDALCCLLGCHISSSLSGPHPGPAAPARQMPLPVAAQPSGEAFAFRLTSGLLPVGSRAPPLLG